MLDPLTLAPTSSDYGEHYPVQTGSRNSIQTGSSNNLATETDVDAISVDIRMSLGASFSLVYTPKSPDASFIQKFSDSGCIPVNGSSYNFATESNIIIISTAMT